MSTIRGGFSNVQFLRSPVARVTFIRRGGFVRLSFFSLLALLFAITCSFRAEAASCFSAPTGLVGWCPGDGSAANLAGTNQATLQGGATASAAGMVGSAFGFDGTNAFVQ